MESNKVDIKAGRLFPFHFLILGCVLLVAGLGVVAISPITSVVLLLVSVFILTAYEGTEVDPARNTYREYYAFFFVKTGEPQMHKGIEGISIHKAKVSQRMFTPRTMASSTFVHVEYNAYLKLKNGEKVFLFSRRSKPKVMERASQIAAALKTSVSDYAVT